MDKITAISQILNYVSIKHVGQLPEKIDGVEQNQLLMLLAELSKNKVIYECKITTYVGSKTIIEDGYSVNKDLAEKIYGLKWPY